MARKREGQPASRRGKRTTEVFRLLPGLGFAGALVLLASVLLTKTSDTSCLQQLRKKGCLFLTASPASWRQHLAWAFGEETSSAVLTIVREGQPLRFVPNGLALAKNPQVQERLQSISGDFLKRYQGLDVAIAARLLRDSNATGVEMQWLRSLPASWSYSWSLNSAQKEVLHGTRAARAIRANDEVLGQLERVSVEGRHLSQADAAWILGFYLHHSVEGQFVPGLLDGLLRDWDVKRCSPVAKNMAATGRLPGWALVAGRTLKTGEQVSVCAEQPNGQLLAMYGVAYPDNPIGAALTQASIGDEILDSMLQQAQLACDRSEVRSLILRHDPEVIEFKNLRCASVLWLGGGEIAFQALSAGYFDTWPRRGSEMWRQSERRLYQQLLKECNTSRNELSNVSAKAFELVANDRSKWSRMVVLVRQQEIELYDLCMDWSSTRLAGLAGTGDKKERTEL